MRIHIIGGGIIGLSSAWYLRQAGWEVTLIDQGDLLDGTSHGNAGMIVPSHFIPLAAPGVIAQGMRWMLNSKSPFYIKPRLSLELAQWLWQFYRACKQEKVDRAMPLLKAYNEYSKTLYQDFAQLAEFDFCFEKKGLLMLYQKASTEHEEVEMAEKAQSLGMEAQILDQSKVQELEQGTQLNVRGGVFYPGDAHLYPNLFIQQLVKALQKDGVEIRSNTSLTDFRVENGKISQLRTNAQEEIPVEQVLVAAGSWSSLVWKKLKLKLLLQDGKGYSTTLSKAKEKPSIPSILTEAKVAVTPMGDDLRIGGTLEISNLNKKVNQSRLAGIMESMPRYYPKINPGMPDMNTVWHGFRPCSPDGLPYMGKSQHFHNLYLATGHAMMGMSLGPASGKMMADYINGRKPEVDMDLFSIERFG